MAELLNAYKVQHVGQNPHDKMHVIYLPGQPQLGDYVFSRSQTGSAFYTVVAVEEFIRVEGVKAKSEISGILTIDLYRPLSQTNRLMNRAEFGPPPVMPAPTLRAKHAVTSKLQPTIIFVDQTNNIQTALQEYQRTGRVAIQVGEVLTVSAPGQPRQYNVKSVVWLYNRDSSKQPIVYVGVEPLDRNYVDFISPTVVQAFSSPAVSSTAPPSGRSSLSSMSSRPPMPLPRSISTENLYDYIKEEPSLMLSRSSSGLSSISSISPGRSSASSGFARSSSRSSPPSANQMIAFLAEAAEADGRLSPSACKNLANNHFEMLLRLQTVIGQVLSDSAAPAKLARQPRLAPIKSVGDTESYHLPGAA